MNTLFPIFVKLDQIQTLLIGGGKVALEKLQALVQQNAAIQLKIVAKEVSNDVRMLSVEYPGITIEERAFIPTDIDGRHLVIAATNNPELNEEIRQWTKKENVLLNAADKPDLCDFYLGSIVSKGNLKVAISTNGKSPTIAKRLKELLNELLPEEIDETLELMSRLRNRLKGDFDEKVKALNAHTKSLIEKDGD
jgi:precorrin-2 dehydrogenase/sirohydrochlorin ferrochelatase